jgi:predicted nuclease with TOPRIM domain
MSFNCAFCPRALRLILLMHLAAIPGLAGVSRAIQEQYKRDYENKAMFLKIPVYSERQFIYIDGQNIRVEQGIETPRYRVGDQVRILLVDFAGDEIKFRVGEIAAQGFVEIIFKFDGSLQENFPNREVFNRALQSTFTEGLKYTEIEDAKRSFIEQQFDRSVKQIANSASTSSDSVLKTIAPRVPAYQDSQREIETLKDRIKDTSGQLSQSQSENQRLQSEAKAMQGELARLKSSNAALQEKIDNSTSEISKLGDELRDIRGTAQGYQRELATIQRSLNLKVEANRDLSMQIADLGQAMKKLQRDSELQTQKISSLQTSLDAQQAANARLVGDNEDLKSANRKMQSTIETLTSKEDSLAKQYLNLKNEKEKLDDFSQSVGLLRTRIAEEKTEGGVYSARVEVYLRNVLLGFLDWSLPINLNSGQTKSAEATFSAESIDYVRMTPEERHILRSLGERLKMRLDLVSSSATMKVIPGNGEALHEIGERDRSAWQWNISNNGTQDSRILLSARLVNKNSGEIPLLQEEHFIAASNAVRQVRSYLQPIPLAAGVVLGFLLFGVVGIFRSPKGKNRPTPKSPLGSPEPPSYAGKKQL